MPNLRGCKSSPADPSCGPWGAEAGRFGEGCGRPLSPPTSPSHTSSGGHLSFLLPAGGTLPFPEAGAPHGSLVKPPDLRPLLHSSSYPGPPAPSVLVLVRSGNPLPPPMFTQRWPCTSCRRPAHLLQYCGPITSRDRPPPLPGSEGTRALIGVIASLHRRGARGGSRGPGGPGRV